MAMIKCRECGKEISSRAECCPNCGAKTRFGEEESEKKQLSVAMIVYSILCVVGAIVFAYAAITMSGDISDYYDSWIGGYNYKSPLTEHEIGIIMQMVIGLAIEVAGILGIFRSRKEM